MSDIEKIKEGTLEGLKGFEEFFGQFDIFKLTLMKYCTDRPFIQLSIEVHSLPVKIKDGDKGLELQDAIKAALLKKFPENNFQWEGGFQGGNPNGWDMWRALHLGKLGDNLKFEEDIVLFEHNK